MIPDRFARISHQGAAGWARITGETITLLPGAQHFGDLAGGRAGERLLLADVVLLPPLGERARLFCVGRNYRDHATEMGGEAPAAPSIFQRSEDSVVGQAMPLRHPGISDCYDFEGEIAIVLRSGGWRMSAIDAESAIGGVTLVMDGSVRDFQAHSLLAGKNFRGSGAIGPWIVPIEACGALDALRVTTTLNGQNVQQGQLADLIWSPTALVVYLSAVLELRAGDIISTGTPAGVGAARRPPLWLRAGDHIEVTSPAIGSLFNTVTGARDSLS